MLRVRLVAGVVLPHQMRTLADVATRYGSGNLHFTALLEADGRNVAEQLGQHYAEVPTFDEDSRFYTDWDSDEPFSLAGSRVIREAFHRFGPSSIADQARDR